MSQPTTSTLSLPWVEAATSGFINAQEMREAVSLALASGLNLILSGPGGHGKSEFLNSVFGAITGASIYVKSFGQGTSTEELYGGLDFDALNRAEGATIQFNPELSFLAYPIAVFEELFDAPPRVLTSLKDTLTAKELRNGHQRHVMCTKVIAAATNHSPLEIAEGGPEIAALIERFPIQLEVKWESYSETDFVNLFAVVSSTDGAAYEAPTWEAIIDLQQRAERAVATAAVQRMLAKIIVELRKDKVVISPRSAVLALRMVKAAAVLNGRDVASGQDLKAIAFLPGAHAFKQRISELIEEYEVEMESEIALDQIVSKIDQLRSMRSFATRLDELTQFMQVATTLKAEVGSLSVTTNQRERKSGLINDLLLILQDAQKDIQQHQLEADIERHRNDLDVLAKRARQFDSLLRSRTTHESMRRKVLDDIADQITKLENFTVHQSLHQLRNSVLSQFRILQFNGTQR